MKQTILTAKQGEILENLIVKFGQLVTSRQIYDEAGRFYGYQASKDLILKLVKNGWLYRIKRELYAISELSDRGSLSLSPFIVANLVLPESYVSFEAALQQYGMFDQLIQKVISVALHQHKPVSLAGITYRYVKTKSGYYFGWQDEPIDNRTARIATPEKALTDMVNFHRSEYAIDLVIEKLLDYQDILDMARLTDYLGRYSTTTIKIFGLIFDFLKIDSEKLMGMIKNKRTPHWMFPGDTRFNAKWRLYYRDYFDQYKSA